MVHCKMYSGPRAYSTAHLDNCCYSLIVKQAEMLQDQQKLMSTLNEKITALQHQVTALSTSLQVNENSSSISANFNYNKPPRGYHPYPSYSQVRNPRTLYCTWCWSHTHVYFNCYRRLNKCFRCGSNTHTVARCNKSARSIPLNRKIDFSSRQKVQSSIKVPSESSKSSVSACTGKLMSDLPTYPEKPPTVLEPSIPEDTPDKSCSSITDSESLYVTNAVVDFSIKLGSSVPGPEMLQPVVKPAIVSDESASQDSVKTNSESTCLKTDLITANCFTETISTDCEKSSLTVADNVSSVCVNPGMLNNTVILDKKDLSVKKYEEESGVEVKVLEEKVVSALQSLSNSKRVNEIKLKYRDVLKSTPTTEVKLEDKSVGQTNNEPMQPSLPARACQVGIVGVVKDNPNPADLEEEVISEEFVCHAERCTKFGKHICRTCIEKYSRIFVYCSTYCGEKLREEHLHAHQKYEDQKLPCKFNCKTKNAKCITCKKALTEQKVAMRSKLQRYCKERAKLIEQSRIED